MRSLMFLILVTSLSLGIVIVRPASGQSPGEINALLHGYVEAWNEGNMDAVQEYIHPAFIRHYAGQLPAEGRPALKELITVNRTAFSDFHVRIKDIVLTDDKAVVSWEASGTNDGPLFGNAPTGKQARWSGISIAKIRDNQIVEEWVVSDQLEMFRQLGYEIAPPQE